MSSKCILDASGNFWNMSVDSKGSLFEITVEEGVYTLDDKYLTIFGLFSRCTETVVDKAKHSFPFPKDKPVKMKFPIVTQDLKFTDRESGKEVPYQVIALPEYKLIPEFMKKQGIEPLQPFSGTANFAVSDEFISWMDTGKFKGKERDQAWGDEYIELSYCDVKPIEKLSFTLPDLGATEKKAWTSTPKQSELDRLNDRFKWMVSQFPGMEDVKTVDEFTGRAVATELIYIDSSNSPDHVQVELTKFKFDVLKLIMG